MVFEQNSSSNLIALPTPASILIKQLPFNNSDDQTQRMLRDCIPTAVAIQSIDIRSNKLSNSAVAYLHIIDSQYISQLLDIFNTTSIFGTNLYAHPFGNSKSSRFKSTSDFTSQSSSRIRSLAQLHIHISTTCSDSIIRVALEEILYRHFRNRGTIIFKGNSDSLQIFVNIYNHSNDSISLILERLTEESIGSQILVASIQNNPRPSTSSELEEQIRWENGYDQTLEDSRITQLSSNELVKLHIASFPLTMKEDEIGSRLNSILLEAFHSKPTFIKIVESKDQEYNMAFVDVVNRTSYSPSIVLAGLPKVRLERNSTLHFNFQKGFEPSDEQVISEGVEADYYHKFDRNILKEEDDFDDRGRNTDRRKSSTSTRYARVHSRSPRRSRSRSPRRKSSIRNLSPLPFKNRDEDRKPDILDPFELVEKDTQSTRIEFSPDPFDIASSTSFSHPHTSLIVSTLDTRSIETLIQPLSKPPDSNNFSRIASTRIQFGYLSSLDAEKVFSNSAPYSNDEDSQIRYEKFLGGQRGDKEYYYNILEKVKDFSGRNKRFSDIAKALVSSDRK